GVWCALEAGRFAVALASLVISVVVITGTSLGLGPFTGLPTIYNSIVQQGYIYSLALMLMVLCAARTQQRRVQRELRDSEERFRNLLMLSSDWYWEQDRQFRFIDISHEVAKQTGIETNEHIGKLRWELPELTLTDEDWRAHRRQLEAHLPFRDFVMRRPDRDGKPTYISVSGEPKFDESGTFAGYRGVGRNISEMRIAEQALRDSEARFRTLWETTNDVVLIIDEGGVIQFANPASLPVFGYAPGELLGQPLAIVQPDYLRAPHLEGMHRYLTTGEKRLDWRGSESLARHQDGREFPVELVFSEIPVNGRRGFVGFMRDISKRKEADLEMRRSQALFSTVFSASPIPIVFSRLADGRYVEANQACLDLFGYQRDEVIGKTKIELGIWPDPAQREQLIQRLKIAGRVENLEFRMRRRGTEYIDVLYSGQVIEFLGEPCIVATIFDVTSRKRAEEERRLSDERFARIFHSSPDSIVISRLDTGVYVELNEAWTELCGYSRDELIGRSAVELGIWADPAQRHDLLAQLEADGRVRDFEFKLRRQNGENADTLLTGEVIELHNEKCLLAILVNVTERNRSTSRLRESERRFADVVDAAGEYVWETNLAGDYIYVSERIERVLGYTAAEMIGRQAYDFMPNEEVARLEHWFDTRSDPGQPIRNLEYISITKDGRQIWQQVSGVPIFNASGERIGYRGTGLDITERKLAEQRIEELATRDALTQLPNRRLLTDRLSQGILAAQRSGGLIAALFIDLDRFKTINDSLGHAAGDELLRLVAERLQALMRKGDTLARIGGDEFVVVLEALRVPEDAGAVAQKIIAVLSEPYVVAGNTLTTSASVGISVFPGDAPDGLTLVRNADMAMYFAKEHGRRNYQFYSEEMNARAVEKLNMESTLRGAIEREEFELYYHPKFTLRDGRLAGVEALVRWNHPELGVVGPGRFIPVSEETGLIVPLGEWVLNRACRQCRDWAQTFRRDIPMAVNLSVGQFNKGLTRTVRDALAAAGLAPGLLELEITESMLMLNVDENIEVLRRLSDLGVTIAIDDFGTGYSSLAYLRRFHVDTLKIDQSFVRDVDTNLDDAAIIEAIIALGHSLQLTVVAEGVETAEQKQQLLELNCDQCQGFLFGEPVPAVEFEARYLR
ncbi:MAG: PAS domain S-box protein, partial [Betaproteobacteria bacterium]